MPSVKHARQDSSQGSAPFGERERERDRRRETGPYLSTCFLPLWHGMVTSLPLRESRGCGHSPSLRGMRKAAYPFLCLPLLFVFVMLFLRPVFGEEWRWPSSSSYVEGGQGPAKEEEEQEEEEEWSGHPLSPLYLSLSLTLARSLRTGSGHILFEVEWHSPCHIGRRGVERPPLSLRTLSLRRGTEPLRTPYKEGRPPSKREREREREGESTGRTFPLVFFLFGRRWPPPFNIYIYIYT